jgi:hypothetical protein
LPIRHLATSPAARGLARWLVAVTTPAGIVSTSLIVVLLVVFPDGWLPSRHWRWFVAVIGGLSAVVTVYQVTAPEPDSSIPGLPPSPLVNPAVAAVLAPLSSFSLFPVAVLVAAVALVIRYRSGTIVVRRQIKWFTLWPTPADSLSRSRSGAGSSASLERSRPPCTSPAWKHCSTP